MSFIDPNPQPSSFGKQKLVEMRLSPPVNPNAFY